MYRESWHGPAASVSLPTAVVCGATGKRISFFFFYRGYSCFLDHSTILSAL